ncbi:hypothetical protein L2E82_48123 [Cichorium intybus]|uniref:Uncharacterized protein n=1 Tax=Cichorium intybus TaxID=13427 RepID=A0ACB8YXM0_CICIN|nr:hypothetical protein L2E82_48123 [Cichorium intybus]
MTAIVNDAKPHVNTSLGTISRSDLNPGSCDCTAVQRSPSPPSIFPKPQTLPISTSQWGRTLYQSTYMLSILQKMEAPSIIYKIWI